MASRWPPRCSLSWRYSGSSAEGREHRRHQGRVQLALGAPRRPSVGRQSRGACRLDGWVRQGGYAVSVRVRLDRFFRPLRATCITAVMPRDVTPPCRHRWRLWALLVTAVGSTGATVVAGRDTRSSLGMAVAPVVGVGSGLVDRGAPPSRDGTSPAGDGGAHLLPAPSSMTEAGRGGAAVTGGGGAADGQSPSQRPR